IKFRKTARGREDFYRSAFGGGDFVARRAASILPWTRRIARATSLVWVLPVFTRSPIWKRHSQNSGSAVAITLYSTPLWITDVPVPSARSGRTTFPAVDQSGPIREPGCRSGLNIGPPKSPGHRARGNAPGRDTSSGRLRQRTAGERRAADCQGRDS